MNQLHLDFVISNKRANTIMRHLNTKISFHSSKDMEELLELVKILFINEQYEACLKCCEATRQLAFDGNYNTWTFIHHIWQFHILLLQQKGEIELAEAIVTELDNHYKIPTQFFDTPEKAYAHYLKICNRQTIMDITYQEKINSFKDNPIRQLDWKFVAISKLIEPITMHNMKNIPIEIANEYFMQYCAELKTSKKYGEK